MPSASLVRLGSIAAGIVAMFTFGSLPAALHAAPYSNQAYSFDADLPAGWAVDTKTQGVAVAFVVAKDSACVIRVYAAKKDHSLSKQDVAKMGALEDAALRKTGSDVKPVEFPTPPAPVDALTAHAFGFSYSDKAAVAQVDRSVIFEKIRGEDPYWFRVRATYPKAKADGVSKDLVAFLASWHFRSPGAAATTTGSSPPAVPVGPPPSGSPAAVTGTQTAGTPASQDDGFHAMSADQSKANWNAFRPNAESRTEEAKRRARALFGGLGNK